MRERTRAALSALIVANEANPSDASLAAIAERAPRGNYYVRLDDGRRAIVDYDDAGIGIEIEGAAQPAKPAEQTTPDAATAAVRRTRRSRSVEELAAMAG